jgi:hypothetical protein
MFLSDTQLTYNVLGLCVCWGFLTLKPIDSTNFKLNTTVDISTKTPLLGMCCYKPFLFTNNN